MSGDLQFATQFAERAGREMVAHRATTRRSKKLDRTDVTDEDKRLNRTFIAAVRRREGRAASVQGEELSDMIAGVRRVWTIDPIDGTGEYISDSIPDAQRTTCIGISLFINGVLVLAVVHNPFRGETFVADVGGAATLLNGRQVTCVSVPLRRGVRYDYCHWDGARFDVRGLERTLGRPLGVYSAIYQACMVAAGRSAFAVFPGDTIHDIAPGARLVLGAAGRVTDLRGNPLRWNDLSHGVIFASRTVHAEALRAIAAL
jgi:fructose-1,6-bisphosphatase/inositol monophosphatase family enzyme